MAKQVRALRAKTTIAYPGGRFIYEGALVRSDDPAVKAQPDLFETIDDVLGIEQAVKNPGQKRAARKPVKNVGRPVAKVSIPIEAVVEDEAVEEPVAPPEGEE
jgi:hypothetical protein